MTETSYPFSRLFLAFVFFAPYVTFGLLESDLSPFYLLIIFARAFLIDQNSSRGLILVGSFAVLLAFTNILGVNDTRLLKLCAAIILAEALFHIGRALVQVGIDRILLGVSIFWALSGLVSLVVPEAFSPFFYRLGASSDRGAAGFTPEPAFFGVSSAFLYALVMHIRGHIAAEDQTSTNSILIEQKWSASRLSIAALLLTVSVVLSASLYAVAVFGLFVLYYQPRWALLLATAGLVFVLNFMTELDLRLLNLLRSAIETGGEALFEDFSIAYRLANFQVILFALQGMQVDESDALASGLSILFITQGALGFLSCALLFYFSSWRSSVWYTAKKLRLLPVIVVLFFIGPMSNPVFWLYLGVIHRLRELTGELPAPESTVAPQTTLPLTRASSAP